MGNIIVKNEGKYYKMRAESLYISVENKDYQFQTESDFPIKEVKKRGKEYEITYNIKNVENYVNYERESFSGKMLSLGFSTEEAIKMGDYVERKGLRFKTRIGFIWKVRAYKEDNGKFTFMNARMINKKSRDTLFFPNVYSGSGDVCWGNVVVNRGKGMKFEDISKTYYEFMETVFNGELEKELNQEGLRNFILNEEYDVSKLEREEIELIEIIRKRLEYLNFRCDGDTLLLLVATLFNVDNVGLENRVRNGG